MAGLAIAVFVASLLYTVTWSGPVGHDRAWLVSATVEAGSLTLSANWATEEFRRASSFYDRGAMGLRWAPLNPSRRSYHLSQAWRFGFDRHRTEHIHRTTVSVPGWLLVVLALVPPTWAWIAHRRR